MASTCDLNLTNNPLQDIVHHVKEGDFVSVSSPVCVVGVYHNCNDDLQEVVTCPKEFKLIAYELPSWGSAYDVHYFSLVFKYFKSQSLNACNCHFKDRLLSGDLPKTIMRFNIDQIALKAVINSIDHDDSYLSKTT